MELIIMTALMWVIQQGPALAPTGPTLIAVVEEDAPPNKGDGRPSEGR